MRPPFLRPPPLTLAERVLGRRRARLLRRRLAFAAMGVGFTLLRPRPRRWTGGMIAVACLVVCVGVGFAVLPSR